jgi:NADH-quinone oxidoreductase subunit K
MSNVSVNEAIVLSAILFAIGLTGVMVRRNLVFVLMSLEIMLAAAAVAFVAAASKWRQPDGQVVVIFILVTAAAEAAVGLSLVLRIHHEWKTVDVDEVSSMKG